MSEIITKNTITENQIVVVFDLQDGEVPSPPINIDIQGDVDLNPLINYIIKLLELEREISVEFLDNLELSETDGKIKLIKETLNEIYIKFNENVVKRDGSEEY